MILRQFKMNQLLLALFLTYNLLLVSIKSNDLSLQIEEIENAYSNLSLKILDEYKKRCFVPCTPSYHSCGLNFPNLTCNFDMNLTACNCKHLNRSLGTPLSMSTSTVSLTLSLTNFMSNVKNYQSIAEIVCSTEFLKNDFYELGKRFKFAKWQYFGGYNGIMRMYPGQEMCNEFDPRIRPWYLSATTGFKNIILMMDLSQSMNYKGKINMLKSILKDIVISLGFYDWIGLVGYNAKALVFKVQLIRMSKENKILISNYIDSLKAEGLSNYEDAFIKAFDILKNSKGDNISSLPCKNFFLFFSDGKPTQGKVNSVELLALIKKLQDETSSHAIISTFNIMKPKAYDILHRLSCGGMGFYYNISRPFDFKKNVIQFFSDIAIGSNQKGPIWSEPYFDQVGLGWITTLTFPLYTQMGTLIGVLGVDFKLEAFTNNTNQQDKDWLAKYLSSRNGNNYANCSEEENLHNPCFLNVIRKDKCSYSADQEGCMNTENANKWLSDECESFNPTQIFYGTTEKTNPEFSDCCEPCLVINKQDYTYFYYIGAAVGVAGCGISILIVRWIRKKKLIKSMKRRRTFLKSVYKTT